MIAAIRRCGSDEASPVSRALAFPRERRKEGRNRHTRTRPYRVLPTLSLPRPQDPVHVSHPARFARASLGLHVSCMHTWRRTPEHPQSVALWAAMPESSRRRAPRLHASRPRKLLPTQQAPEAHGPPNRGYPGLFRRCRGTRPLTHPLTHPPTHAQPQPGTQKSTTQLASDRHDRLPWGF